MNTNKTIVLSLSVLICLLALSGCGTQIHDAYIAYDGPPKPLSQVAIVDFSAVKDKLQTIDGVHITRLPGLLAKRPPQKDEIYHASEEALLMPGKHTFVYQITDKYESDWKGDLVGFSSYEPIEEQYTLHAGRVYQIVPKMLGYRRYTAYNPSVKWFPRLVDKGPLDQYQAENPSAAWFERITLWQDYIARAK